MSKTSTPKEIEIDKLILDKDNPRFAELYSGSDNENDLINYLLYAESAEDVAQGIIEADEFYQDRALWVLKEGDKYIVKDGNRRCAAVKALQFPDKYGLDLPQKTYSKLPTLVYKNIGDLEKRIRQEHTSSLFKQWSRIAKALEVYRLFSSGSSVDSMKDYDSQPPQLIKLASFYYAAVNIGEEDFKKLLRSGRGRTGGKTIIFERLFKYSAQCGYTFKRKPHYIISITDEKKFESYIEAMVTYLKKNPGLTHGDIDKKGVSFLDELKDYGFSRKSKSTNATQPPSAPAGSSNAGTGNGTSSGSSGNGTSNDPSAGSNSTPTNDNTSRPATPQPSPVNSGQGNPATAGNSGRKSIKHKPIYKRKKIPSPLESLIKECYDLNEVTFANAKMALSRVTFECVLKYVVENTKHNGKKNLSDTNQMKSAYWDQKQKNRLPYTNFTEMKKKFTEMIKHTGTKKAFEDFDLQRPHQIIHNYNVRAIPSDAKALCDNLIPLIEFMLQDETDLLNSLDLTKL